MPFKGFCLTCSEEIEAETKQGFGDALIAHHLNRDKSQGGMIDRCNVMQCQEYDNEGKPVKGAFGLDVIMEIVTRSWTGEMWYQKGRGRERG